MDRLKSLFFYAALLAGLALGLRWVLVSLGSPEDKIRWRLEQMAEGFNETRLAPVLAGLEDDYRDAGSGRGRDDVADALRWLFLHEDSPAGFLLRVEIPETELGLVLDPEGDAADVRGRARFYRREQDQGGETLWWDARFVARFEDGEDGWQIVRTAEVNHAERGGLR